MAPAAGHSQGPGSVCKQTGHVAPAARSPPPVPAAPRPRPGATPAPDPTSAAPAGGCRARSKGAGPPGPRGGMEGDGDGRPALTARPTPTRAALASHSPGSQQPRPARAAVGSAGMRSSEGPPGRIPGPGRALKATAAAAAAPHPSGPGRGLPGDGHAPAPIPSAQHIATRRGLAAPGRSPCAANQSAKDGTPPPASQTSAPHPPPPLRAPQCLGAGCGARGGRRDLAPRRLSPPRLARRGAAGPRNGRKGDDDGEALGARAETVYLGLEFVSRSRLGFLEPGVVVVWRFLVLLLLRGAKTVTHSSRLSRPQLSLSYLERLSGPRAVECKKQRQPEGAPARPHSAARHFPLSLLSLNRAH